MQTTSCIIKHKNMKIFFDHPSPFFLAHGGYQIQIEQTKAALERLGYEVEFLRWWDDARQPDLIHYFGVPSLSYIQKAQAKGIPVVITHLLTATCNRPKWKIRLQGQVINFLMALPGWGIIRDQLSWRALRAVDKIIVGLQAEAYVLQTAFGVAREKIAVIPLGLPETFLNLPAPSRDKPYLITTGTITQRKRSVELADMALAAKVPLLFVGKPYSLDDPYWGEFQKRIDGKTVMYREHVSDTSELIGLLQGARGFVIYSLYENWCLSAHEAAACGLPLLLQDQNWSRECFADQASYLRHKNCPENIRILSEFYNTCPAMTKPEIRLFSWNEVGEQINRIYREFNR
jgi:glycosyltransferase involved in cell wall biosynthesis